MRPFSKDTNKIYMMTSRGIFMCRIPPKEGFRGFGLGETMQEAYNNAVKHQKRLQELAKPVVAKPWWRFW